MAEIILTLHIEIRIDSSTLQLQKMMQIAQSEPNQSLLIPESKMELSSRKLYQD